MNFLRVNLHVCGSSKTIGNSNYCNFKCCYLVHTNTVERCALITLRMFFPIHLQATHAGFVPKSIVIIRLVTILVCTKTTIYFSVSG